LFEVAYCDLKQEGAYPYSDMRLAHCANSRGPHGRLMAAGYLP
jgi:hypothetical protein